MSKKFETWRKPSIYDMKFELIARPMIYQSAINEDIGYVRWSHTLRVKKIAKELAKFETDIIDIRKIETMAVIHDMFKYVENEEDDHGAKAADYLSLCLTGFEHDEKEKEEWDLVLEALKLHSSKDVETSNPYLKILIDADILDKVSLQYVVNYHKNFRADEPIMDCFEKFIAKVNSHKGLTRCYNSFKDISIEKTMRNILNCK